MRQQMRTGTKILIGCLIYSGSLTFLFLAVILTLIVIFPRLLPLKDTIVPVVGIIFGGSIGAFITNEVRKIRENVTGVNQKNKDV